MSDSGSEAEPIEPAEAEEEEPDDEAADGFDPDRLAELVEQVGDRVTDLKRAIVDDEDGADVVELAEDLWEVLDELEDLLATLDLEELPEAIDVEDLPDAVDVEDLPEALFDEDEAAIELGGVREAVELRELWDAVDLTQFLQEKRQLESAIDDVGEDEDGEDDDLFENVVDADVGGAVESTARQAVIEEKILSAVEKFRSALLSTHDGLRKVYEKNQEKLGNSGGQPNSLNPTAASTMPPGPIPDSVSTRASTVPTEVRYSRVDNPRRIYGRRFAERRDDESANGEESTESGTAESGSAKGASAEGGPGADADAEAAEAEAPGDGGEGTADETDDVPRIEVFEDDA